LNSDFVVEHASYLAARAAKLAAKKAAGDPIEAAFLLTLSRRPTPREQEAARSHVTAQEDLYRKANLPPEQASKQTFTSLCHMLLSTSEFLYID
jgi:alpha-D-ribose 1-methylphosphonate 5-triphosphate synthase subunit PhnI